LRPNFVFFEYRSYGYATKKSLHLEHKSRKSRFQTKTQDEFINTFLEKLKMPKNSVSAKAIFNTSLATAEARGNNFLFNCLRTRLPCLRQVNRAGRFIRRKNQTTLSWL